MRIIDKVTKFKVQAMINGGTSHREIARALDIGVGTVSKIRNEEKEKSSRKRRKRKPAKEEKEKEAEPPEEPEKKEKEKPKRRRKKPAKEESPESSSEKCTSGGNFGKDCNSLDECETCDIEHKFFEDMKRAIKDVGIRA